MKISKSLILSASVLALSSSLVAFSNESRAAQLGIVQTVANATMVYSSPAARSQNRTLLPGTNWKYFKVVNYKGNRWYNLGGNQWVNGSQVTEISTYIQPTISGVSQATGVATVTYRTPIVVWAVPGVRPIKKYLPTFSSWRYFKIATTRDGETWYNLGGNQWVPSRYVNYGQDPRIGHISPVVKAGKVATVNRSGARIFQGGNSPKSVPTNRILPAGSRWKVFGSKNYGILMYNLGGQQWVRADTVSLN